MNLISKSDYLGFKLDIFLYFLQSAMHGEHPLQVASDALLQVMVEVDNSKCEY